MTALAPSRRILPNELIAKMFSSLITDDADDGLRHGPDEAAERNSLKWLGLGRTVFFYARLRP